MSDSVDRVFVHALATVRRLPRTGSSRPPPTSRLRLYGLYKQSMEGDVLAILPRPTLPVSSPDLTSASGGNPNANTNNNNNNNSVHRYASRDVRTREAQAEIEKWDAWHACAGMSRTDAKREYISTLIETMKEYASGTAESRELVNELEFVWSQIRSQSGSGSGSDPDQDYRGESGRSPVGKKQSPEGSGGSNSRPGVEERRRGSSQQGQGQSQTRSQQQQQERPAKQTRTQSGLRVMAPVSQDDSASINSPVDAEADADDAADSEAQQEDDGPNHHHLHGNDNNNNNTHITLSTLQTTLETHIHTLRTEIAALREQLSTNNLLSASTYTLGHHYYSLTPTQRFFHRVKLFIRTYSLVVLRQVLVQLGILGVVVLWGRCVGDLRVERVVRDWLGTWRGVIMRWGGLVGWWIWDVLGRVRWLGGWPVRRLRRLRGVER